jgi:hypothetical protein
MTEQQTPASVVAALIANLTERRTRMTEVSAGMLVNPDGPEAAALIERLSAERQGLRGALEPFASMGAVLEARSRMTFGRVVPDDQKVCESSGEAGGACLRMRDFRRARAALTQGESRQTGAKESGVANTGPVQYVSVRFGDIQVNAPMPGFRHHHILTVASYFGHRHGEQGFAKADGTFLTREAAATLALASGQVTKLIAGPDLYSEDIW